MIISINGGDDGWSNYVLNGTKDKPRNQDLVSVIRGDLELGDKIVNTGKWNQNAYHIVLGFKGRVDKEIIENVLDDFETNFLLGFDDSEYHFDAVLHADTDDDHVHIRIPKMNLVTQTQLRLYFDKKDRKRLEILRDFLDIKYDLQSPKDNIKLIKEEKDFIINKWRDELHQKPFDFSTKATRKETEKTILNSILLFHELAKINDIEDLTKWFEARELKVEKYGYDTPNSFHYATISSNTVKIRIKGDIFSEDFWGLDRDQRLELIAKNLSPQTLINKATKTNLESIEEKLKKANDIRLKYVEKTYHKARSEAHNNYKVVLEQGQIKSEIIEQNKSNAGEEYDRIITRNLQRIRAEREAQQTALREFTKKRRRVFERITRTEQELYAKLRKYANGIQALTTRIHEQIGGLGVKVSRYLKSVLHQKNKDKIKEVRKNSHNRIKV